MDDAEGATVNAKLEAWLARQRLADAEEALSWLLNELRDLHDTTEVYVNVKEAERQVEVVRDVLQERSGLEDVRQR